MLEFDTPVSPLITDVCDGGGANHYAYNYEILDQTG